MEWQALFLGILFSLGSFAIKSGIGLHHFCRLPKRLTTKVFFLLTYAVGYALLFCLSTWIIQAVKLPEYFTAIQTWLQSGMLLHLLLAGGLIWWGLSLLRRGDRTFLSHWGWLPLVIPCPVCCTVIFFTLGLLLSWFPGSLYQVTLGLGGFFFSLNLLTMLTMYVLHQRSSARPEAILAHAMLIIAVYFLLSILFLPQFGDLDRIYRLASHQSNSQPMSPGELLGAVGLIAGAFGVGLAGRLYRWRK